MFTEFRNLINREIDQRINQIPHPRWGVVLAYDPSTHLARCTLQPEGVETGWLPIMSPWIGNGWGLMAPLSKGQQCLMVPHDASPGDFAIMGLAHSEVNPPPRPDGSYAAPGEFALVHQSGSYFLFGNSGDVQVISNRDLTATVGRNLSAITSGTTTVNSTGNLTVNSSGNATVSATGTTTIQGNEINLDSSTVTGGSGAFLQLLTEICYQWILTHEHSGVTTGGGTSGPPTTTPPTGSLTSNFQAS